MSVGHDFLTVSRAAREFGVRPATIRRWCAEGRLEYQKVPLAQPIEMPAGPRGGRASPRTYYRRIHRGSLERLQRSFHRHFLEEAKRELVAVTGLKIAVDDALLGHLESARRLINGFVERTGLSEDSGAVESEIQKAVSRAVAGLMDFTHDALSEVEQNRARRAAHKSEALLRSLVALGADAGKLEAIASKIRELHVQILAFSGPPASVCLDHIRAAYELFDLDRNEAALRLEASEQLLTVLDKTAIDSRAIARLRMHIESVRRRLDSNV